MTARRQNETASAFARAMARKTKKAVAQPAAMSKFTVLLSGEEAAQFDELVLKARRQTGRPIKKADFLRALIGLTSDDATIRNQLIEELKARK